MTTPLTTFSLCPWCGPDATIRVDVGLRDGCADGTPDAWTAAWTCLGCATSGPWAKADTAQEAADRALSRYERRWHHLPRCIPTTLHHRQVLERYDDAGNAIRLVALRALNAVDNIEQADGRKAKAEASAAHDRLRGAMSALQSVVELLRNK